MSLVRIVDDLLPPESFRSFGAWSRQLPTQRSIQGTSIFQGNDENPYEGVDAYLFRPAAAQPLEALLPPGITVEQVKKLARLEVYPTGTPMDAFFEAMFARTAELTDAVGQSGERWVGVIGRTYAYPVGGKVIWHTDKGPYAGAFIYYTHDSWHQDWGGQLLYHDDEAALRDGTLRDGSYATPKPNRLVVLRGGTPHTIAGVSQSATQHMRTSFAGFFIRPDGVEELIRSKVRSNAMRAGQ